MNWIVLFFICVLLFIIIHQDFKYRAVNWVVFPFLAFFAILYNLISQNTVTQLLKNSMFNLIFIILQFCLLYLYFALKNRKLVSITEKVGAGDLFFLVAISLLFSPVNFILFYIISLIFSLAFYGINFLIFKTKNPFKISIPLAGLQSLFLIAIFLIEVLFGKLNITNDIFILSKLFPNV